MARIELRHRPEWSGQKKSAHPSVAPFAEGIDRLENPMKIQWLLWWFNGDLMGFNGIQWWFNRYTLW